MYKQIINPETNRNVNINSVVGKTILNNYVKKLHGGGQQGIVDLDPPLMWVGANSADGRPPPIIEQRHNIRMTRSLGLARHGETAAQSDDITGISCFICDQPQLSGWWLGEHIRTGRLQGYPTTEIWCENCNTNYMLVEADGTYRLALLDDVRRLEEIRVRARRNLFKVKSLARAIPRLIDANRESAERVYAPGGPGYYQAQQSYQDSVSRQLI